MSGVMSQHATDPALLELLSNAAAKWAAMPSSERARVAADQRRSYVIAEAGMGSDADETAHRVALANDDHDTIARLHRESETRQRIAREWLQEAGL